ncbi:MAG: hypothetical protein GXY77_16540 [Fibrobacter sp.]|nr:hypothetical protein [Fibrobacter sp.]
MKLFNTMYKNVIAFGTIVVFLTGTFSSCQSSEGQSVQKKTTVSEKTAKSSSENDQKEVNKKVTVYYFHTTNRCYSCNLIEKLTKQAIDSGFKDQIDNKLLQFKSINIDLPENKHFVEDYKLYTKSVIVSTLVDGKETDWKNLEKVWTLLRDQEKFAEYIQTEIKTQL